MAMAHVDTSSETIVHIAYTNHRGEFGIRKISPGHLYYGVSPFHEGGMQWFLRAYCHTKKAQRDFAMRDIAKWDVQNG